MEVYEKFNQIDKLVDLFSNRWHRKIAGGIGQLVMAKWLANSETNSRDRNG
jgi:hypothetical protein